MTDISAHAIGLADTHRARQLGHQVSAPTVHRLYQCYDEILSRIVEEPIWFDEHAVPRYCEFAPDKLGEHLRGRGRIGRGYLPSL